MAPDLTTRYLGLTLRAPVVASAGPHTSRIDSLRRLADAGVGAVVLPSLFEEEAVAAAFAWHDLHRRGTDVFAEALSYLPAAPLPPSEPERAVQLVADAKDAIGIPVIASVNGTSRGGWIGYARELEEAGADAIELNLYHVAADPADTSAHVEALLLDVVTAVRDTVSVPVAVKLSPWFTALASVAVDMVAAGADGLVLFNRFYQPDIDLDALDVAPTLELSTPADLRLPLRWVGLLHGRIDGSLALSGGVHGSDDVVKALLAGADAVMTTSSVLRNGPEHVGRLLLGLQAWMAEHDYDSVAQMRGAMSHHGAPDPDAYERANYVKVIRRAAARFV